MLFTWKRSSLPKLKLKKPTVFCLPGFHVDPVWHLTQAESVEQSLSLVREYLLACRADPYYGVFLSEIDYLKPYLDLYPEERVWVAQLIQQERCITGGAYNQPNETSIGGEAFLRNLILGQAYHKTVLRAETPVYMAWDTCGHIPQLPQILNQFDIQAVVFTRSNYRDSSTKIPGMPDLFQWIAPDGSAVYAQRMPFVIPPEVSLVEEAQKRMQEQKARQPDLEALLLLDAGYMASPRAEIIGRCRDLGEADPAVVITGAAATRYFSYVNTLATSGKFPIEPVTRDMSQYNVGGELSRMDLKIANRLTENRLYEAELWTALAALQGFPLSTTEVDHAWRQLAFCQSHGAITGGGNDIVLADLLEGCREALECAARARDEALRNLASVINTQTEGDQDSFFLFNSLPWRHDGVARVWLDLRENQFPFRLYDPVGDEIPYEIQEMQYDADGRLSRAHVLWVQKEMPPAGYQSIEKVSAPEGGIPYLQKGQSRTWLENEFYRVEVDPDRGGGIVSLYDKELKKEFIQTGHHQPANDVMAIAEGHGEEPALHLLTRGGTIRGSESRAVVQFLEGPVSSRLLIHAHGPGPCDRVQEICLYKDLPYIDCTTVLQNHKGHGKQVLEADKNPLRDLYVLAFPFDLPGAVPVLEDRFYAKAYRRSRSSMIFNSAQPQWDARHAMNSCFRWVDLSWTFRVQFVNGEEETSGLALGPAEAVIGRESHRDMRQDLLIHLVRHGITGTPRFDRDDPASDRLYRQCSFSIGTKTENAYTRSLLEKCPDADEYFERTLREIGYVVLAVPDFESKKKDAWSPVFLFAGRTDALTRQALDEMIRTTGHHRWEIPDSACFLPDTPPPEDLGIALLNRGNTLCSLEADGTLAVSLMHTAPYPSPQTHWPFDFAEHKSHVFQYRLIPHPGDWRQAEIPHRAMEYNVEPLVMELPPHEGLLPARQSFFSLEPGNILVSSIKPAGFPDAEHRPASKPLSSLVLRVHEAHGEDSNIWLETPLPVRSVRALQINEQPSGRKREVSREDQFIRTVTHAHEILTLGLDIKPLPARKNGTDRPASAPGRVIPSRYWRSNLGAAPAGFMPVSLSLRGSVRNPDARAKTTLQSLDLVLVNNSPHQAYEGRVDLEVPSYWRTLPAKINYRLPAGAFQVIPFHLIFDTPQSDGFVKARAQIGGFILEDLIHIGAVPDYDLEMTLTRECFNVRIRHEYAYTLSGTVSLVSPVEAWPDRLAGAFSLSSITPMRQSFAVAAGDSVTLSFTVAEIQSRLETPSDHSWMIIKISVHHSIRYYHVRLDGQKSEGLGRVLLPPYEPLPIPAD